MVVHEFDSIRDVRLYSLTEHFTTNCACLLGYLVPISGEVKDPTQCIMIIPFNHRYPYWACELVLFGGGGLAQRKIKWYKIYSRDTIGKLIQNEIIRLNKNDEQ